VLLTQCILDRIVKPVDGLRINHGQMIIYADKSADAPAFDTRFMMRSDDLNRRIIFSFIVRSYIFSFISIRSYIFSFIVRSLRNKNIDLMLSAEKKREGDEWDTQFRGPRFLSIRQHFLTQWVDTKVIHILLRKKYQCR